MSVLLKTFAFCLLQIVVFCCSSGFAQGTAFNYQGRLNDSGSPANGNYELKFTIFDALTNGNVAAGPLTNTAVGATNGLFTVTLDFGQNVFTGRSLWLEMGVRPAGGNVVFTVLSPRQAILSAPYSIYSQTAGSIAPGGITGIPKMQVFTSSDVFTVPAGVNTILVEVWGGGGGGGNGTGYNYFSAGGGGGGGYGKDYFTVTPGAVFAVTVGSAGSPGQAGGSSSFGTLISASGGNPGGSVSSGITFSVPGGSGGSSSATFNSSGAQGSGGASGSSLSFNGGGTLNGFQSSVAGGAGGAAGGGGGGGGGGGSSNLNGVGGNGGNGSAPGGGGGGSGQGQTLGMPIPGGTGGNGRVVVYW